MKKYRCGYCMAGPCIVEMADFAREPVCCVHPEPKGRCGHAKWLLLVAPANDAQQLKAEIRAIVSDFMHGWDSPVRDHVLVRNSVERLRKLSAV